MALVLYGPEMNDFPNFHLKVLKFQPFYTSSCFELILEPNWLLLVDFWQCNVTLSSIQTTKWPHFIKQFLLTKYLSACKKCHLYGSIFLFLISHCVLNVFLNSFFFPSFPSKIVRDILGSFYSHTCSRIFHSQVSWAVLSGFGIVLMLTLGT